jgi:hypothetical protein
VTEKQRLRLKRTAMTTMTTRIGRFIVPVRHANKVLLGFVSGGYELGWYAFWTAMFEKAVDRRRNVIVRARVGFSAGERFERIGRERTAAYIHPVARKEYGRLWKAMGAGRNIKYVRAATVREVERWLASHQRDAAIMNVLPSYPTFQRQPEVDTKKSA